MKPYFRALFAVIFSAFILSFELVSAEVLVYQPGPSQGKDIRVEMTFQNDNKVITPENDLLLQVGADPSKLHAFMIDMDLEGLPKVATKVLLTMVCVQLDESVPTTDYYIYLVYSDWDEQKIVGIPTIYNPPSSIPAPKGWTWINFNITNIYNSWQNGNLNPNGLLFWPKTWNNQLTQFISSDYSGAIYRPKLTITYTPPPLDLNFPLSGSFSTSKITGYDFGDPWEKETCIDGLHPLLHTGIDLKAYAGNSVYAAKAGVVKFAREDDEWGGYICIEHEENGSKFTTAYTHVTPMSTITAGKTVSEGQQIGRVASIATGPHLHFQVRNSAYHPAWSIRGRLPEVECYVLVGEKKVWEPAFPEHFVDPKTLSWH